AATAAEQIPAEDAPAEAHRSMEAAEVEAELEKPAEAAHPEPQKDAGSLSAAPARFVWRTDAEGRFSQISPEFVQAVGEEAADILGRRFREVANAFGLDPSSDISGLLERRDTWSGRSVMWPVAGTNLHIPVDLAALPVYDRNRNFQGFR